ncbi:MAG: HRDC domain-containing protein [Chloroflexota bacterium]
MISSKLSPPLWVGSPVELQTMVDQLSQHPRIAIDTESNSLHAFREQVCLIQFSIPDTDYLLDPLAVKDLSLLSDLFSSPKIEKTFHAAEYDLLCLKRDFEFSVVNLFDTMQAARILGYPSVGLNHLLFEKYKINVDKRFQKSDWARRPLPDDQLNYARMDTHFLLDLRDLFYAELINKDLWALASEEFQRIGYSNGQPEQASDIPVWQRINGINRLTSQQLPILNELLKWRLIQAERMNRPVFKVVSNNLLLAIAQSKPNRPEDLQSAGLSVRQIHLYGNEIIAAVKKGMKQAPIKRSFSPRPDQDYLNRMETLRLWRRQTGEKFGFESDLVLPRAFMQSIAENNPQNIQDLAELMPHSPWRLEHYGQAILNRLKGR